MDYEERDSSGSSTSFKPFGVVSNEALTVGIARSNFSFSGGQGSGRHSSSSGRDERSRKKHHRCRGSSPNSSSHSGSNRRGGGGGGRGRGVVLLLATPQELGDRCVKFIKEQRSRLHIIRRCAVMLACWPKYR